MANLATDLSDGVNLLRILEIVSTESLGRWNPNPRIRVQRAENLDIGVLGSHCARSAPDSAAALKFIAAKGIVLTNISAEDILDSNLKLILGLVWTLLFRFSVQSLAADGINAKDALLIWVQEKIDAYDVPCEDWSRSFADGRVLCAPAFPAFVLNKLMCTQLRSPTRAQADLFRLERSRAGTSALQTVPSALKRAPSCSSTMPAAWPWPSTSRPPPSACQCARSPSLAWPHFHPRTAIPRGP
jgi:hypothetical protein